MLKKSLAVAILIGATGLSGGAYAQTASSAWLGGINFQLIDLDTHDGITPSLTFDRYSSTSASVAPVAGSGLTSTNSTSSTALWTAIASANSALGATTSASIKALDLAAAGTIFGTGEYESKAFQQGLFILSPNTELVLAGHASAYVNGSLTLPENTSASVSVQVVDTQDGVAYDQIASYSNGAFSYDHLPTSVNDSFTLHFFNNGSEAIYGTMETYAVATGSVTGISPVPEPEMFGMLLGGLALFGVARSRKQG